MKQVNQTNKLLKINSLKNDDDIGSSKKLKREYNGLNCWKDLQRDFHKKLDDVDISIIDNLDRPSWMNNNGYKRLQDMALLEGETVAQCFLRVAIDCDKEHYVETFNRLWNREFNFSTSTLRNAGGCRQFASCFLGSASNKFENFANQLCGWTKILNNGSAVGIGYGTYPAIGEEISPLKMSSGLLQQMKMINEILTSIATRQNKRADGAIYTDIYHSEIYKCIDHMDPNHHHHLSKVKFGVMARDNFFKAVFQNKRYHLFSDMKTLEELSLLYGDAFDKRYNELVEAGKYSCTIDANELFLKIVQGIMASGSIYFVNKDTINHMSNQANIGPVVTSNLCVEIMQHTNDDTMGICTLGTMCLPTFVKRKDDDSTYFDFDGLRSSVSYLTGILDCMVDQPYNFHIAQNGAKHRALGIGYSGLYDAQMMLGLDRKSDEFHKFNMRVSEHIYFASLSRSTELALERGIYKKFYDSPASQGKLQFDLYAEWEARQELDNSIDDSFKIIPLNIHEKLDPNLNWTALKETIKRQGLRNSLLTTAMPTAGSSIIQNVNESFENIYSHIQNIGTDTTGFIRYNEYVYKILKHVDPKVIDAWIFQNHGNTFMDAPFCSQEEKNKLETVFDCDFQNEVLLSAERQRFICQSQSFNLYISQNVFKESMNSELASLLIYGWRLGLKTGCYYFRPLLSFKKNNFYGGSNEQEIPPVCNRNNKECEACSM